MGNINKKWHLSNKMPENPSHEQRMKWHLKHNKNCQCHPISIKLQKELADYKMQKNDQL